MHDWHSFVGWVRDNPETAAIIIVVFFVLWIVK